MTTSFEHVFFAYGSKKILEDFTFEFPRGKVTAVTGPSGTGKTTLLKLLTGVLQPDAGKITVEKPAAVMYQEPRLLPWFTVRKNLTSVLGKGSGDIAMKWLAAVELAGEADSLPDALSGGMQQRVSLARTLAYAEMTGAPLILLDEPFSGLDPDLHARMRQLVFTSFRNRTIILITHDAEGDGGNASLCL